MVEYTPTGKYFEDFNVGDAFCTPSRTVETSDITNFAGLSSDFVQLHVSEEYASKSMHGGRIAHGVLSLAISTGEISLTGLFDGTILAFLSTTVEFTAVVRPGDTIRTIIEVAEKKETKKPNVGVIKTLNKVYNQNDTLVLQHTDTYMLLRKPM